MARLWCHILACASPTGYNLRGEDLNLSAGTGLSVLLHRLQPPAHLSIFGSYFRPRTRACAAGEAWRSASEVCGDSRGRDQGQGVGLGDGGFRSARSRLPHRFLFLAASDRFLRADSDGWQTHRARATGGVGRRAAGDGRKGAGVDHLRNHHRGGLSIFCARSGRTWWWPRWVWGAGSTQPTW